MSSFSSSVNIQLLKRGLYSSTFVDVNETNLYVINTWKDEKPEEWMFYRNPFLDPSIYAYWLLTDEEKELIVH